MLVFGGGIKGAKKRSRFTVVQAPASRRRRSLWTGHQRGASHPRLATPMRLLDIAFFVAAHDDHHLARITEILRGTP